MKTAWCPQHRGVMRISFFDPPPKCFFAPCPRCGKNLVQETIGKKNLVQETIGKKNLVQETIGKKSQESNKLGCLDCIVIPCSQHVARYPNQEVIDLGEETIFNE